MIWRDTMVELNEQVTKEPKLAVDCTCLHIQSVWMAIHPPPQCYNHLSLFRWSLLYSEQLEARTPFSNNYARIFHRSIIPASMSKIPAEPPCHDNMMYDVSVYCRNITTKPIMV